MSSNIEKFDIKVQFENAPDTSKMNKMSEEDVDRLLTTLPGTKLAQARKILLAMDEKDSRTEAYKKALNVARLYASANKEKLGLGADKDREAWATSQDKVVQAKKDELTAILEVKLQEHIYEYLDDLFISARKQANKYEKQIDNDRQWAKYNTGG